MGVMDNLIKAMQLSDTEEMDLEEEYIDDPDPVIEKQAATKSEPEPKKITKAPIARRKVNSSGMEVCVIKPTTVEESKEIIDTLLANRTVILNMEGLDMSIAQRIIDYTSGACYAIRGNLQKISHYIFIITPASVDVSGDFPEIFNGEFDVPVL